MKKRSKFILHFIIILGMVVFDELIKLYIVYVKNAEIDACNSNGQLIHFHPTYNTAGSFLALQLGTQISRRVVILLALLFSVSVVCLGLWCIRQLTDFHKGKWAFIPFDIVLAGCIGRIVERCFRQYTLDYIAIRGFAICDLLDIYLFTGVIGVVYIGFYIDYLKSRKKKWNGSNRQNSNRESSNNVIKYN